MPISDNQLLERQRWLERYQNGDTYTDIANDVGVHRTTVMRSIKALESLEDSPEPDAYYETGQHLEEWNETISRLNSENRYLIGLVGGDHHFVDHDPTSIMMDLQIKRMIRPDFVVLNGDVFDFPAVAKFLMSRREPRQDILRGVRPFYKQFVEDHLDIRMDMPIIFNSGNHNVRLDTHLALNWQTSETVEDAYRDLVRQDGAVVMHDFLEEFLIGALLIQHGTRTNLHSYKSQAEDVGFGVDVVSSHKHIPGVFYKRAVRGYGKHKVVTSAVTGCLCRLVPQYASHTTNLSKWINGVAMVAVNPQTEDSHITPINFHQAEDGLFALVGGEVIHQPYVDSVEWWE